MLRKQVQHEKAQNSCLSRLAFRFRQLCQTRERESVQEEKENKPSSEYKTEKKQDEDTLKIISNLKLMQMNDKNIQRILNSIQLMPGKDHLKGALRFLTEVTANKSRREDYYQHSNYIAEFFCTLSNLGLFAVAYYYGDFAVLAAATFSALSHAIPSQRLHDMDILGVFIIFGKAIANYKVIMEKPEVLAWGMSAATVNVLDTIITRKHLDKIGPSLHVAWHLSAAFALYKFNQAQYEINESEMQSIVQGMSRNEIPTFLNASYEIIQNCLGNFSKTHCVIC